MKAKSALANVLESVNPNMICVGTEYEGLNIEGGFSRISLKMTPLFSKPLLQCSKQTHTQLNETRKSSFC